ncbi:DUF998 domain-containing protein, partial [Streptomyces sp. NPDC005388]|uniref:DUF998 domain-containing protein n=1 Tax=Streptomyces sp. NPDC005388 TaxID=3156717 RepID=UPI0033AE55DC
RAGDGRTNEPEHPSTPPDQLISNSQAAGEPQPGTPDQLQRHTRAGALHDLLSLAAFLALTVACFVLALSDSLGWAIYSIASGVLFAATMVVAGAAFDQNQHLANLGGLIQRTAITIGWTWLTLLAAHTLHT